MARRWTSTNYPGVRYREHKTRKHGVQWDKYFSIYYRVAGKRREEGLGWASEGWSAKKASIQLAKLKEAQKTGQGPQTLDESRRLETERKEKREQEKRLAQREGVTFQTIFDDHYLPIAKQNKKPVSWKQEETLLKTWISPVIGSLPLKDISPFHLEKIKKELADAKRAPRTIQYALATVRQVFNFAINHDLYSGGNPVPKVKMPKVDNKRIRFLTHNEADRLLEVLSKTSSQLYEMSLISLNCGLRSGEIFALRWVDLDLYRGTISVLDSKGWNRVIPMTNTIKEMLSSKPKGNPDDLIFPNRLGNQKVWMSKSFARVVDELGLNNGISDRRHRVTFHTLRHTYASWLVEKGVDLYTVKELLGHSTLTMTERYSHVAPGALQAAVRKLDASS